MTDIVERIRGLRYVHVPAASGLMAEAAAEIERLRLTDAERAAIEESMRQSLESDCISTEKAQEINATLRSLLARLAVE
jgi:hypothetical protein